MAAGRKVPNLASGYALTDALPQAQGLDWDDFRVFTTVAREGSYTRAARQLSLTQSAVSRRIARLEKAIGSRLFDRGTRGTELTSEGLRLLNFALGAELNLARGVGSVRDAARRIEGDCKVLMGHGFGAFWMPQFIGPFLERNPNIGLKLFTTEDSNVNQTPLFDVQIQHAQPVASDSVAIKVGTLHFALYASPEYLANYGKPLVPQDLSRHRILDLAVRLTDKGSFATLAGFENIVLTNSSAFLGEAVLHGAGIALLPTYASAIEPSLIQVVPETHYDAPISICFEREAGMKPAVRATIEYFKEFVFDRRRMPWYFEEYVPPHRDWKKLLDNSIARASLKGTAGQAAAVAS